MVRDVKVRRKHNNVRDCISKEDTRVDYVSIDKILEDPLTKGLANEKVHNIWLMPIEEWVARDGNPT